MIFNTIITYQSHTHIHTQYIHTHGKGQKQQKNLKLETHKVFPHIYMHTERKVYLFVQTCGGQRTAFRAFEKTPPISFETGCLIVLELTN